MKTGSPFNSPLKYSCSYGLTPLFNVGVCDDAIVVFTLTFVDSFRKLPDEKFQGAPETITTTIKALLERGVEDIPFSKIDDDTIGAAIDDFERNLKGQKNSTPQ